MCNDFGNRIAYRDYVEAFSHLRLPLVFPTADAAPNLQPRDEIWPTDPALVIRAVPGGVALEERRWGLAPSRPKARAVINLRSEGRSFARGRCLVPASHYFEFTGSKSPKARWRFTRADGAWFCFAGLLGSGETTDGAAVEAFALLTADAGPDVRPIHGRQPVILERADWGSWLQGTGTAEALLRPSPAGSLVVAEWPRSRDDAGA